MSKIKWFDLLSLGEQEMTVSAVSQEGLVQDIVVSEKAEFAVCSCGERATKGWIYKFGTVSRATCEKHELSAPWFFVSIPAK